MPALIRSASLTHYADICASVGLDAHRMLAEAGLPAACLRDPDLKIPAEKVGALLERSAELSGVPTFGLRMAETRRLSNLGPIGLAMREESTLRGALEALRRYGHLHTEATSTVLEDAGDATILRVESIGIQQGEPQRQSAELIIGVIFRMLSVLLGASWRPRAVCFTHTAPADRSLHERLFGPVVQFGQEFNGIVLDARDLDRPLPSSDPVMARYARQYLEGISASQGSTLSREVRQLVLLLLPSGHGSIDDVAQHLGVSRRTIHRHLAQDGETFSSILETVRTELARRYLAQPGRPLAEVAVLLGFSEPSAFSRWFRGAFGCSARRWRLERSRGTGQGPLS